jgi:2-methylcitrate dehydratase
VTGPFELGALGGGDTAFAIERTNLKFLATEYHAQAPVALALDLRRKVDVAEIEAVDVRIYAMAHSEIGSEPAKWDPRTRETADHSLPYMLAVALTDGRVGPSSFEPARYLDPALRPLMRRIRVLEHAEFTGRFPQALVSEVEIRTRQGDRLVERAEYPKGHGRNPMTDADVEAKFRDLAADTLHPSRIDAALAQLWRLDDSTRLDTLLDLFTV